MEKQASEMTCKQSGWFIHWPPPAARGGMEHRGNAMAADKQHAHQLLDKLGPEQLAAVVHLLETMVPPEEDGDTLSDSERQAVSEADEWLKQNQPIPHEEVLAEFGLTMSDWEEMGQEPLPGEPRRRNG